MAKKKKTDTEEPQLPEVVEEEEETAIALVPEMISIDDLMAPTDISSTTAEEAGMGSEDVGSIIVPRLSLNQGLSKPITEEMAGAKLGCWWISPFNRPVTMSKTEGMRLVVVRLFEAQRLWTPIDEGGGLVCEASNGDYIAREPCGLANATLDITADGDEVKLVEWVGGEPTDNCKKCVYGPAAAARAAGKEPTGKKGDWLPKILIHEGKSLKVPDPMRAPKCTHSLDALVLVVLPAFTDEETGLALGQEVIPAFVTFSRSGLSAGRTMAGMIKMSSAREPAWSKIFSIGSKGAQNASGQKYFVPSVQQLGYSNSALAKMARDLFEQAQTQDYRPHMDDEFNADVTTGGSTSESGDPPSDDEPTPEDEF